MKKNKLEKNFEKFMYIIAFIFPFTTLPQIIEIYGKQSAANVSLITWTLYSLSASSWVIYATIKKDKILLLNNILWVTFEIIVVIGIIIYA